MALDQVEPPVPWLQLDTLIADRGSKYSVTAGLVHNNKELKAFLAHIKSAKKYAQATHNSYAARVVKDSAVYDTKSDDGETGAGMVILRILQKKNMVNVCVVVTRWYGGVQLHADRFKHVQDATVAIIGELQKLKNL